MSTSSFSVSTASDLRFAPPACRWRQRLGYHVAGWCFVLFAANAILLAQATGSIQGTVKDDSGKALPGINVLLTTAITNAAAPSANTPTNGNAGTGAPPSNTTGNFNFSTASALSDSSGNFSFSGVKPGNYMLCLSDPGNNHLDPCAWSTGTQISVTANATAASNVLTGTSAATLQVRVDDPQHLLDPSNGAGVPMVAVIRPQGGLEPMNAVSTDSGGRTFQGAVPPGDHKLLIYSNTFKIANGQGQDLGGSPASNGAINVVPVNAPVSVSSGMSYVTVTITGTR